MELDSINMQFEVYDRENNINGIDQLDMKLDSQSYDEPNRSQIVECAINICLNLYGVKITKGEDKIIFDYLTRFPHISSVLVLAASLARDGFGNKAKMDLGIYKDELYKTEFLKLYVRQRIYDKNVLNRIKHIRKQYLNEFENIGTKETGWFLLTTDFNKLSDENEL